MIQQVEYNESDMNNDVIASDVFYNTLLASGNQFIIDEACQFYINNRLTSDMRYSGIKKKIISINK